MTINRDLRNVRDFTEMGAELKCRSADYEKAGGFWHDRSCDPTKTAGHTYINLKVSESAEAALRPPQEDTAADRR